jgi:hypothetical protein
VPGTKLTPDRLAPNLYARAAYIILYMQIRKENKMKTLVKLTSMILVGIYSYTAMSAISIFEMAALVVIGVSLAIIP